MSVTMSARSDNAAPTEEKEEDMTIRLIKLAVLYLVVGMTLGIAMGISHDFLLRPVHAHVNLLGFAVLAVAAFIFHAFPDLARTRLATAWFWLYNIAMPVGLVALALMLHGKTWAEPALIVGQLLIWASACLFAIMVLWNLRAARAPATVAAAKA
jgi:cbb3-type cytochrome oxidase subunit 1